MTQNRTLDWNPVFDPNSKNYAISSLLTQRNVEPRTVLWEEGTVTDQGSEGACVGFAWMNELLATPYAPNTQPSSRTANRLARSYYYEAQKLDDTPGENYVGTSVLAGAKVIKNKGFIDEYRWCFNIEDIRGALISEGPVVIGVPWYKKMYETTPEGLVVVGGSKVGGHAILLTGYVPKLTIGSKTLEVFRWRNSWGPDYGVNGSGWITAKDLKKLMRQGGEACVPMKRSLPSFKRF